MAYLNPHEERALKDLVYKQLKVAEANGKKSEVELMLHLLDALDKDEFYERIKEDVVNVVESLDEDAELTDEQLDDVIRKVQKYDYSDYNEFISDIVDDLI